MEQPSPEIRVPLKTIYRHTETGELIDINGPNYEPADAALELGIYMHYKSTDEDPRYYVVKCVVRQRDTGEEHVAYEPLYDTEDNFPPLRPLSMFCEDVEHNGATVPRFSHTGRTIKDIA